MDEVNEFYEVHKSFPVNLKANVKFLLLAGNSMEQVYKILTPYINRNNFMSKCPRCNNTMVQSKLFDGRSVIYCTVDRVTLPT